MSTFAEQEPSDAQLFYEAARDRDPARMLSLTQSGRDINTFDGGWSALYKAVAEHSSDLETIKLLLCFKANPGLSGYSKPGCPRKMPLHLAAMGGNVELVKLLLDAGAHPAPRTLRYWRTPLEEALQNGHFPVFSHIIETFLLKPFEQRPTEGVADAVILAASRWSVEPLILLLNYGKEVKSKIVTQDLLRRAFCAAIEPGSCGCDVESVDKRFADTGVDALLKILNILLEAGANFCDEELQRILYSTCCDKRYAKVVQLLLTFKPRISYYHLFGAIDSQSLLLVQDLIMSYSDLNDGRLVVICNTEPDVVQYAAMCGSLAIFRYLYVTSEVDQATWGVKIRPTPIIHFAVWGLQQATIQYILYTESQGTLINKKDEYGQTPLMYAFDGTVKSSAASRLSVIQYLIEQGSSVTARSNDGLTVLHYAVRLGSVAAVRLLLKVGANPNAKAIAGSDMHEENNQLCMHLPGTSRCRTPLHYAVDQQSKVSVDTIWALLESGADINACDADGVTPLNLLLAEGWDTDEAREVRIDAAMLLVQQGADVDIKSKDGKTARKWASERDVSLEAMV
ncbi:ankyrin [Aspergillus ellipticus CBS 707.79]|uniref:Ankyrin n=1 Tax=Aspergillus ellipticus CBS 707.79 TaxID=1448320 RepID=A0A319DFU7_9EURO|nr:ankyrin [Aspergillus ellipticus CBS 707.79]